jgi:Mg2+ and Co2+ transporter CorA
MSFEAALDKTEADILEDRHDEDSVRLSTMRKTAARLRRMLSSHRIVFSSLARPDFMPDAPRAVATQFNMLENQFQNAMDAVEGTRVLVIGTLEVLTNRIALRTNKSLRVLSFAAGTFGFMSVVVGAMGMNFQTRFFQTADTGFFITVGAMLVVSSLIVFLGARRKWF